MATSSIHIEKGSAGYFAHNDRTTPTKNSIFSDEENEYSLSAKEAFKLYRDELSKRSEAYTKRTGQKLQKNAITHLSAIVNLNSNHTLKDLEPLLNYLEQSLDTKILQVAVHRDEGHISDNKEKIKNYHAHIELLGLDSKGSSVRKKLTKSFLKDLQTKTAEFLQMERGQKNSKAKRLDTYEFKNHKQREALTVTGLKKELEAYRKELMQKNKELEAKKQQKVYTADDYKALSLLKKETKRDNLSEIYEKFLILKKELEKKELENKETQKQLINAQETILNLKTTIDTQKDDLERYEQNMSDLEHKIKDLEEDAALANYEYQQLKTEKKDLEAQESDASLELTIAKNSLKKIVNEFDIKSNDYEEIPNLIINKHKALKEQNKTLKAHIADIATLLKVDTVKQKIVDIVNSIKSKIDELNKPNEKTELQEEFDKQFFGQEVDSEEFDKLLNQNYQTQKLK